MTPRMFCRDCGHWEHDPGSCDGLGHYWHDDLPVVTDCTCEVYDDQRGWRGLAEIVRQPTRGPE